jgi:serine/threonine protein kinase
MQKFCPDCGRVYEDETATTCADDGERLMMLQGEPDLVGEVLEGKYHIKDRLGQGGMGTVYRAHQSSMARDVAIKVLRPQFALNKIAIQRFLREARAASQLRHPNTITVYDSGQTDEGHLFLVMEMLQGTPLSDVLAGETRMAPERAAHVLAQICDSLSEAHEKGIIHRDMKAENVFLERTAGNPEHVKVLDFGIAKMTEEANTQATATGMICGTPAYMSPEQAMGRDLKPSSDVYALGVLLFEMLAGTRPFSGTSPMEVMLKHINDPVPPLPDGIGGGHRAELTALLESLLEKKAVARPQTCQEVKQALRQIFQGITSSPLLEAAQAAAGSQGGMPLPDDVRTQHDPATLKTGLSPVARASSRLNQGIAAAVGVAIGVTALIWVLGPGSPDESESPGATRAVQGASKSNGKSRPKNAKQAPNAKGTKKAKSTATAPASGEAQPGTQASPDAILPLLVESVPSGATVKDLEGKILGTTPWDTTRPALSPSLKVTLELEGHQPLELALDAGVQKVWSGTLSPVAEHTASPEGEAESGGETSSRKQSRPAKRRPKAKAGKKVYPTF